MADISSSAKDNGDYQTIVSTNNVDNITLNAGNGVAYTGDGADLINVKRGAFFDLKNIDISEKKHDRFSFEVGEGERLVHFIDSKYPGVVTNFYIAVMDKNTHNFVSATRIEISGYVKESDELFKRFTDSNNGINLHSVGSQASGVNAAKIDELIALGQTKEVAQKLAESGASVKKAEADAGNPNLGVNGKGAADKKAEPAK